MADEQTPSMENVAFERPEPKPLEGVTVEDGTLKATLARMEKAAEPVEEPKAEAEPKAEEKQEADGGDLPEWIKRRVAKAKRQRDEERARADEFAAKLAEAQDLVDKLKAKTKKLDPADFESFDAYKAAKAEQEKPVEEAKAAPASREVDVAWLDIREEVEGTDGDLWDKAMERAQDGKFLISPPMVMWAAQHEDPALVFRALFDAGEDAASEFAEATSDAAQIRRLKQIVRDYRKAEEKPAPPRDPVTGQFRKQSEAPEPISPVSGGASGSRPMEKMSTDEFIRTRNAEQAGSRFSW